MVLSTTLNQNMYFNCCCCFQGAWLCLAVLYTSLALAHGVVTLGDGYRRSLSAMLLFPTTAYSTNPKSPCSLSGSLSYGFKTAVWQWAGMGLVYAVCG
jgi:hypothetical protein